MGHLALTRAILLTFFCTATAADTVTSNGKASSCPNEQVKELNIQSSLIQVVSGSHSQTDVAVIAAQEFPEAEEANALEQAIAAGVHIQDLTKITFDCKIGLVHWRGGWSDLKKAYCCRTEHIGCLESTEMTEGSPSNVTKSEICVTGKPLINLIGYTTSQAGTPCIFGLDERDENEHCILSDMKYGSMGWCYTSTARDSWGPCSESCPLFGPLKVLGNKVKKLRNKIKELVNLTAASSNASDSGEAAETPAAEEKKEKKEENKGKEEKGEKGEKAEEEKEEKKGDKKEEEKEEKKDEKKEEKDKATKAPKPAPKPE